MKPADENCGRYQDDSEIKRIVERFEACEFSVDEFKHADHLTVALWYLAHLPHTAAITRMRDSLVRFTAHHQVTGYHETITLFWMKLVSAFLKQADRSEPLHVKANRMLKSFASSKLILEYYSETLLYSTTAKTDWVDPDLKAIGS